MRRHSTGMMVGGIVMTSLSPIPLFVAMVGSIAKTSCESSSEIDVSGYRSASDCSGYEETVYGGLLVGAALLAVGIPMIVIGAKKVPVATVNGFLTPHGGGLGLRVDL